MGSFDILDGQRILTGIGDLTDNPLAISNIRSRKIRLGRLSRENATCIRVSSVGITSGSVSGNHLRTLTFAALEINGEAMRSRKANSEFTYMKITISTAEQVNRRSKQVRNIPKTTFRPL